jgi:hypothetical protein
MRRVKDIIEEHIEEFEMKQHSAASSYNFFVRDDEKELAKKQKQYLIAYAKILEALRAIK